jgi:hypothetical protein
MRGAEIGLGAREYHIAIITAETATFPNMQHFLAPRFKPVLAQTEKQIQAAVADLGIRAMLMEREMKFDLCIRAKRD